MKMTTAPAVILTIFWAESAMFKKPVCPHCGAIYDHKEISKQKNNSTQTCHNCKKCFIVRKTGGKLLLYSLTMVTAVALNIFLLTVIRVKTVIPMLILTAVIIFAAQFLQPFFVRYVKENITERR